ncbi:MAG: hypothetical protein RML93_00570 [Anaerolineales bacterium]|nr:hypothetical protein [Anaerolineales bacterium]MDW8445764.1 hypothetical protein [Anaerolineales bacterium]
MKVSLVDRLLFLMTAIVASYQIAIGIEGLGSIPTLAYTVGFGALLVAGLLILILGFEVLQSPVVVVVATLIPLSLAIGMVWEYLPGWREAYVLYAGVGLLAIGLTRFIRTSRQIATLVLAVVHGVAGLTIVLLPLGVVMAQRANPAFLFVSLGGALIGLIGLLLSFLRMGSLALGQEKLLRAFTLLFFGVTVVHVLGFVWR